MKSLLNSKGSDKKQQLDGMKLVKMEACIY